MKTLLVGLCMLIGSQLGIAQGKLIGPQMQVPDSIVGKFTGGISLNCFVTGDGKIIAWQIIRIFTWERRGNPSTTLYRENLKWYYRNTQTGQYEPQIVGKLKFTNTSYGIALAHRLTPWLDEYVKKTRFQILDSTKLRLASWVGNMQQGAIPFGMIIEVWGKKKNKERHQ